MGQSVLHLWLKILNGVARRGFCMANNRRVPGCAAFFTFTLLRLGRATRTLLSRDMKRPTCSYYNKGQDQHNTLPARGYPATLVKHTLGSWLCHPGVVMLLRSGAFGMNCHPEGASATERSV